MKDRSISKEKLDIVKGILFFSLTTIFSFLYWLMVFLLISFLTLSFIHFTIEGILILSIAGTIIIDIIYIIKKIKK